MSDIIEADFGLDSKQNPKKITDVEALVRTLLLVLLGKPGCYPSIPDAGMNIQQYLYKFADEIDTNAIKVKLAYQCQQLSDLINSSELDVQKYSQNGYTLLVFSIPIESSETGDVLAIGITTNISRSVLYNYEIIRADFD